MVSGDLAAEETAVQAALRVLREATGLTPLGMWAPDYVHTFYDADNDAVHLHPVFAVEVADVPVTLDEAHDSQRWIEYEQAYELLVWPGHRDGLRHTQEETLSGKERASRFQVSLYVKS